MATQPLEITRLMNNARIYLPGALDGGLKLELFNVLDEFLQKSQFWQEDITYNTVIGRTDYELAGGEAGTIVSLLNNINSNLAIVGASMATLGVLSLDTAPSQVDALTATVAYTVVDPVGADDYPQIPDGLLQKYGVGILAGLLGRMMSQPAKPWTNERLGIFNLRKFGGAIAQASSAVRHENVYGGQTWRFPQFAAGHQRR